MEIRLDKKDEKILELLKENSKLTTSQISKKTAIPVTTVHNRIKKLEKLGIIKNYTLNIDFKKLGYDIVAFILVTVTYTLPSGEKIKQEQVAQAIKKIGAEEVYIVTGGTDIIAKVRAKNIDDLNDFVTKKLRSIEGVDKTQTMIVLQEV
ncbi:MAG: Lrp/AsnC family transcriptional regulator [Candidatus Pacearchaeota archaeon]